MFGMKGVKSMVTPLAPHFKLSSKQSPTIAKDKAYMKCIPYASAVVFTLIFGKQALV
jgi:hypothetical protein